MAVGHVEYFLEKVSHNSEFYRFFLRYRKMEKLSRIVREYVIIEGACTAGIATIQTLSDGPPSSDLTYVLPKARSAISFAVALDQSVIPPYLMKKEWLALEKELIVSLCAVRIRTNAKRAIRC